MGAIIAPAEKQRLLAKLKDLRAVKEVETGFKTKRDALTWGGKIEPLLTFNALYKAKFQFALGMLHGNLSQSGSARYFSELVTTLESAIEQLTHELEGDQTLPVIKLASSTSDYVSQERLKELWEANDARFDLSLLIEMCTELNSSRREGNVISIIMLTRGIVDHVPPIFGCGTFNEVANNYGGGGKSFKESMESLNVSSRKIADRHLHTKIRSSEVLPTITQVDFSNDLDVLLGEIVRVLKPKR